MKVDGMRFIRNNKGFALITSLMFTMLGLVLTMTLLYLVTSGIKASGSMKMYRSTTEAAYGGVDIIIKDIIANNLMNATTMDATSFSAAMTSYFPGATVNSTCLQAKLTTPRSQWPAACSDVSLTANEASHDVKFILNGSPGVTYNVYAKIVDTMEYVTEDFANGQKIITKSTGNTDLSQVQLESGGVVDGGGGGNKNPSQPYMYRIEVQAESPAKSTEKSKISVQYVY